MKKTDEIKLNSDYKDFNNDCIDKNKCPLLTYIEMRKKEKGVN